MSLGFCEIIKVLWLPLITLHQHLFTQLHCDDITEVEASAGVCEETLTSAYNQQMKKSLLSATVSVEIYPSLNFTALDKRASAKRNISQHYDYFRNKENLSTHQQMYSFTLQKHTFIGRVWHSVVETLLFPCFEKAIVVFLTYLLAKQQWLRK